MNLYTYDHIEWFKYYYMRYVCIIWSMYVNDRNSLFIEYGIEFITTNDEI